MKTSFILTSTALAALATGVAAEQHSGSDTAQMSQDTTLCEAGHVRYDRDDDGELTAQELDAAARESFKAMDTDDDGTVTRSEYVDCLNNLAGMQAMESDRSAENMAEYDADEDGTLTRQEFMQASAKSFDAMTADPDAETDILRLTFWPVSTEVDVWKGITRDEAAARSAVLFASLDTDQSGTVARDEWAVGQVLAANMEDALNERFDEADTDASDGMTEDEYSAMIQERGAAAKDAVDEDYEMPMNTLTPDEPAV